MPKLENYEQHICADGHLFESDDIYRLEDNDKPVCHCGAKSVWYNCVYNRNGVNHGFIPPHLFKSVNGKIVVPTNEEVQALRTYTEIKVLFIQTEKLVYK